jgi:hypothetical protein
MIFGTEQEGISPEARQPNSEALLTPEALFHILRDSGFLTCTMRIRVTSRIVCDCTL